MVGSTNTMNTKPQPSILPFSELLRIGVKQLMVGVNEGTYLEGTLSEVPTT
jgi:hypothetical protein